MPKVNDSQNAQYDENKEVMKNWRAWGSWFSWGSPVGLGLFLLMLAGAVWIFAQIPAK